MDQRADSPEHGIQPWKNDDKLIMIVNDDKTQVSTSYKQSEPITEIRNSQTKLLDKKRPSDYSIKYSEI